MSILHWLKIPFFRRSGTNYKPLIIPEKVVELIELMDNELVQYHNVPVAVESRLIVKIVRFSLKFQVLPIGTLHGLLEQVLHKELRHSYIPRTIAFFIEPDGTWVFCYGIRGRIGSDEVTQSLFIDSLLRTNSARGSNVSE